MMNPVIRYALAALLLLGSTLSHADTGTWWQGYHPEIGSNVYSSQTPTNQFCRDYNSDHGTGYYKYTRATQSSSNTVWCERNTGTSGWKRFFSMGRQSGECPASLPHDDGAGNCTDEPPIECEAGSDTFFVRYTFDEMNAEGFYTDSAIVQNGGCAYDSSGVEECGVYTDGVKACLFEYTQTDNEAQGSETTPEEYTDGESPQENTNDDTGQTTYTEDPPVTNPDGSVTQTTNETTTNTTGSGTTMWNDEDYIYVRDSTGTTTIYDRQNTTTTNTDGTVDETVVTTKSTQTPSTTTTTVNKNTGNATTTQNSQSSTSSTTTTTNNYYDADGNLTGSNSTTTGGNETENEGDEEKEGNCGAPGQPDCAVSLNGEDHLTDPSGTFTQSGQALDERIEYIENITDNDISESLLQFTPVNLYSGNTCDPSAFSSDYHGATFTPFSGFCSFYDADVRPILAFFFYCLTVMGCYFIWVKTMRGSA